MGIFSEGMLSLSFNKEKRTMKNLLNGILCLAVLVCFSGCGTSPVEVDATHYTDDDNHVLYRGPAPKPDCKKVKCGPPPRPGE